MADQATERYTSAMYDADLKQKLEHYFGNNNHLVVVQGDNPDGDSLASSLALEQILHEQGKEVTMLCSIDVPEYLKHMEGWSRVVNQLPHNFDGWVLVDCEYMRLLDNYTKDDTLSRLRTKPLLIIDHHDSPTDIDFAECIVNDIEGAATGQVIYNICQLMSWNVSKETGELLVTSIMSDTLGLTSVALDNRPAPLRIVADLVEKGVSLSTLNERRLARLKITPEIFKYKGELIRRTEFHHEGSIATLEIPHDEIKEFSMEYNPTVVLDEARYINKLAVMIGFKSYERNGKVFRITGRIRCTNGYSIARDLAASFDDGGGHAYAAGFKVEGQNLDISDIKKQAVAKAHELLSEAN